MQKICKIPELFRPSQKDRFLSTKLVRAMKSRKRVFYRQILQHCYQRTVDGYLLFYNVSDYLVFFTLFCTVAKKHGVTVLSLCQMPDHLHHATRANSSKQLSDFVGEYTRRFSREHNETCHHKGQLFASPFGSAVKKGDKKGRSNLLYIGNNPVERRLCRQARQYRWNYLAFYKKPHPFSEDLILRDASSALQKAVAEVKICFRNGRHLNYFQLQRLFRPLDNRERLQLTDYIISTYNVIDYEEAIRFFGTYDDMLNTMDADTGSEYDINEVFLGKDDSHYAKLSALVARWFPDVHDVLALSPDEKFDVFLRLSRDSRAMPEQIARFLRMPLKRAVGPLDDVPSSEDEPFIH